MATKQFQLNPDNLHEARGLDRGIKNALIIEGVAALALGAFLFWFWGPK